jgi:lipid-A-disaccharide synthase
MQGILECHPSIRFEGIGGPLMIAKGLESWTPMERLSVMGLIEVLKHLPELLQLRAALLARWRSTPPDLFIGIDAPDFNLALERRLRRAGVVTVHYVCPTIWAWRTGRVETLKRAADLLLSIFPFEVDFLQKHGVSVRYVGHPLANAMRLVPDRAAARDALACRPDQPVIALLPGSRRAEVDALAQPFLEAVETCKQSLSNLRVVVPLVNQDTLEKFQEIKRCVAPDLPVIVRIGGSREAMAAADVVLTASGTATLEGLLSKRPMVVGYKVHPLTYWLAKHLRLVKVKHVAMANLLADERLAPELLQDECSGERLAAALLAFFNDPERVARIKRRYQEIHKLMHMDSNREAAAAVLALLPCH